MKINLTLTECKTETLLKISINLSCCHVRTRAAMKALTKTMSYGALESMSERMAIVFGQIPEMMQIKYSRGCRKNIETDGAD